MKKYLFGLLFGLGLAIAGPSCIIVDDHHHRDYCPEGALACHDDEHVEECIDGYWEIVDHCEYDCGGVCDYDDYGDTTCFCP